MELVDPVELEDVEPMFGQVWPDDVEPELVPDDVDVEPVVDWANDAIPRESNAPTAKIARTAKSRMFRLLVNVRKPVELGDELNSICLVHLTHE